MPAALPDLRLIVAKSELKMLLNTQQIRRYWLNTGRRTIVSIWRFILTALTLAASVELLRAQGAGLSNLNKVFTKPKDMQISDWSDPKEVARTWRAALVYVPTGKGSSGRTTIDRLAKNLNLSSRRYPTVILLHGCAGIWQGTHRRLRFLADNGYLAIAPASFARLKYPKSCDPATRQAGLYRGTLNMRQYDAGHAIEMARSLAAVDGGRIALMGHSQGGVTVATFKAANEHQAVRVRIIEAWTCQAGWSEYNGLNAAVSEPVLSLVGEQDPWFQNRKSKGHCAQFIDRTNGSKSVLYTEGPQARAHGLSGPGPATARCP